MDWIREKVDWIMKIRFFLSIPNCKGEGRRKKKKKRKKRRRI